VGTLGGSIETTSTAGQGTSFLLRLPLTTALTQVVLLQERDQVVAVPAALMESVQRVPVEAVERPTRRQAAARGEEMPFYWLGGLLGHAGRGVPWPQRPVVLVRKPRPLALHVDEVLGNQEVVVKNLGPSSTACRAWRASACWPPATWR
jgi:chemosensory pili system protein ChpA (sensor histidine kinase/response regulator)